MPDPIPWDVDEPPARFRGWYAARALRPLTAADKAAVVAAYTAAVQAGALARDVAAEFGAAVGIGTWVPVPLTTATGTLASIRARILPILQSGAKVALQAADAARQRSAVVASVANAVATVTGASWVDRQVQAYRERIAAAEAATRASLRTVLADVRAVRAGRITDPAARARIEAQAASLRRLPYRLIVAHLLDANEARDLAAIAPVAIIAAVGGVAVYFTLTDTIRAICAAKQVGDVAKANADTAARAIAVQQEALKALPRDARGNLTPEAMQAAEAIAATVRDVQGQAADSTARATAAAQGGGRLMPAVLVLGLAAAAWWWWKHRPAPSRPMPAADWRRRVSLNPEPQPREGVATWYLVEWQDPRTGQWHENDWFDRKREAMERLKAVESGEFGPVVPGSIRVRTKRKRWNTALGYY